MPTTITLGLIREYISRMGIPFEKAWIIVPEDIAAIRVVEQPKTALAHTPIQDRIEGLCPHVRAPELFDLLKSKFGDDIDDFLISPLVKKIDGGSYVQILISSDTVTFIANIHAFRERFNITA